jgi:hypothetical protein
MVKLLKCPMCHKHIHTLKAKILCVEHADLCINGDGVVVKTDAYHNYENGAIYVCPHCEYQDDVLNVFIHDIDCDCEHNELTCIVFDGFDIEICGYCGMLISSEDVELRQIEPA